MKICKLCVFFFPKKIQNQHIYYEDVHGGTSDNQASNERDILLITGSKCVSSVTFLELHKKTFE